MADGFSRVFRLGPDETLLATVKCKLLDGHSGTGNLFLTPHWVCFHDKSTVMQHQFADIMDCVPDGKDVMLLLNDGASVKIGLLDQSQSPTALVRLIRHIWRHQGNAPIPQRLLDQCAAEGSGNEQETLHEKNYDSSSTLQSAIRTAEATRDSGANTLTMLHQQGEQISRSRQTLGRVEGDLNTAEYLLRGIGSWGGMIRNAFSKPKAAREAPAYGSAAGASARVPIHAPVLAESLPHDGQSSHEDQFASQNRDLDHLSSILSDLSSHAHEMDTELASHNTALDEMETTTETLHGRMKKDTKWAKRLT